jgi:outer membrane receptor protein involved in Fe transport
VGFRAVRARLANGKLTVSANAFRYEMSDAQRTQTIFSFPPGGPPVPSTQIDNAPRAWSKGLEVELDWKLSPRFRLNGAIGLLDTRITRTLDPGDTAFQKSRRKVRTILPRGFRQKRFFFSTRWLRMTGLKCPMS